MLKKWVKRIVLGALALAALFLVSCDLSPDQVESSESRLTARPGTPTLTPTKGLTQLGLSSGRDGILYVPESYSPDTPMPLFIGLHGASSSSSYWRGYYEYAEERGMIFMAPDSRASTWDFIQGDNGADLQFLDQALQYVFDQCNIDPTRLALAGFSDGASYALSLGITNGDLFSHLIGFSPGFVVATDPLVGKPQIYVSHGSHDAVLPVETSRDIIVPNLLERDYEVVYNEFPGGHTVPISVYKAALDWFLGVNGDSPSQ